MPRISRPSLYRTITVVMSDGATFRVPSALRMVGKQTLLERDPANHPVYLGTSDQSGLLTRREEVRLSKVQQRRKTELFDDDEEDN